MTTRKWGILSCAGLLALGGCASMRGNRSTESASPGARQVATSQEQSERALDEARNAQKRASEQARKADQAQQDVQEAQRRLAEARQRAQSEAEKARRLQEEANQATERAGEQARESQQQASSALATQSERTRRGEQMISGQVLRASDDELVVRLRGRDESMTFRITEQTQVRIAGAQATASEIRQGEDARVSYQVSGIEPMATEVQVLRSDAERSSAGSSGSTGSPDQGSSAPPPTRGQQ